MVRSGSRAGGRPEATIGAEGAESCIAQIFGFAKNLKKQ
jgi:hypothetical protein